MRVLVLGGGGLLGHKLVQVFKSRFETSATFHGSFEKYRGIDLFDGVRVLENVDAENFGTVTGVIAEIRPDVMVNAIGVTKHVADVANTIRTITINSLFPHQLATIATEQNIRLIGISTDCVFAGGRGNYSEQDAADATDIYGKTKHLGEVVEGNCLTIRTSIIGRELFTRNSLVEWFLANRGGRVKGFARAIFTGFPTIVLAEIIADVIDNHKDLRGLYHLSSDKINKFDLLQLINDAMSAGALIEPDNELSIDRSLDSTKFRSETGFTPQSWPQLIKRMAGDVQIYDRLEQ